MGEWNCYSTHALPRQWMKVSGQLHAAVAVSPWKAPAVAICYEARWTPGEQEKLSPLPGIEPQFLGRPARSLVAHQTLVGNIYVAFCGCDAGDTGIQNYILCHFDFVPYSNVKFDKILLQRANKLFLLCVDDLIVIMYISTCNRMY